MHTKNALRLASVCLFGIGLSPLHAAGPADTAAPTSSTISPAPASLVQRADENRSARLLEKAVARYREVGDAALLEFNRSPEFADKELYVYVVGTDGTMLASGGPSANLVGRNVADMKDVTGKPFFRELLDAAATTGSGRVEYRWENRTTNRVERKVTLFEKVGDRILAVGYYLQRASPEQAKAFLERAVAAVKDDQARAIDAFNRVDGGFMQDDLYVFAVDLASRRFVAHGATPALVGRDAASLRDPKGKSIVPDMINIADRKGAGELDYAWRNPVTEKLESKHSYFRKVDGVLVGVGYYTR